MPDPGVHLAQVNCALNGGTSSPAPPVPPHDAFSDLCNDNGINGYPQMNLYRDGEFVDTYSADREFHLLLEYLGAHAEPKRTSEKVEEPSPAPSLAPTPTEQLEEATPTPTPSPPADHLVVQTPRTDANPSGTVVSLDVQTFDSFLVQGPAFIKFFAPW